MARRRTERGPLTRAEIVDAGLAVADDIGMEKFSLAKVADRLGVQTMSLYNHIADRSDLLDAMADAILADVAIPEPTPSWHDDMTGLARAFRDAALRHPHIAPTVLTRRLNTPAALPIVEAALDSMRRAQMPEPARVPAVRVVIAYLIGSLIRETGIGPQPSTESELFAAAITDGPYPNIRAVAEDLATIDHAAEFDRGLQLMIDALTRVTLGRSSREAVSTDPGLS